jgi:acyl-CoA synthetase (AMP-forming)/AMP-acid ligase II
VNVASLLTKAAREHPGSPAVACGQRVCVYAELDVAASKFGSALLARGLEPGDRVGLCMTNRFEYPIAMLGALRAGLPIVPINAKLHPREVAWILENADVRAAVTDRDVAAATPVQVSPGPSWEDFLAGGQAELDDAEVEPDELAWLFYTSGTTGFPKGAMLSHRNLLAMTMSTLADVCDFRSDDVVLHPAPLSHGCGLYLLASIARGARNLLYGGGSFDAQAVLGVIARERVSVIAFMAPTQIVRLLGVTERFDTSSLRRVIYGGGPIHVEDARTAMERLGPVLCQIYGQGEAPMTISALTPQQHAGELLASAGTPRTNVDVRIEHGEVLVRGDVVMTGYWRNPEATAAALSDGWLHTGDLGTMDAHGRLFLSARKSEMIVSGGTNIYPREVEEALRAHPDVLDACAFGIPDREWGESVIAAVVSTDGRALDSGQLIEFCQTSLASFKKPREVITVASLPRNAYGKLVRRELRDNYLRSRSRS